MPGRGDVDIEVIVFDVLGTMVDESGGLRSALGEAVSASGVEASGVESYGAESSTGASVERALAVWWEHVEREQRRIGEGVRTYANSDVIDREAAERVAEYVGLSDPVAIARLAGASRRLRPWGDSVDGLARLAGRVPVLGLSHASRGTLLRLNAYAGLRWHQALSGEEVRAYKPAQEVYRLAIDAAGCPAGRVLMVAAHAWDLRGAQEAGMRTAYVQRPVGDPPTSTDSFDWRVESLEELAAALKAA